MRDAFTSQLTNTLLFLVIAFLTGMRQYFTVVLICISLMVSDVEIFSCVSGPCVCLLWTNAYAFPLQIFLITFLKILSCLSSLYILDITPYQIYHLQISSPISRQPLCFVDRFLHCARPFSLT